MSPKKSKITLNFLPKQKGHDLITLDTQNTHSHFHCEKITADFYDQVLSVSLSGHFDGGARVKGKLKSHTESHYSVLKFLETELNTRCEIESTIGIDQAKKILELELGQAIENIDSAKSSVKNILKIYADDFDWSRDSLKKSLRLFSKKRKSSLFYELPYSSISSFLSIETIAQEINAKSNLALSLEERFEFHPESLRIESSTIFADFNYNQFADYDDVIAFIRISKDGNIWEDYEARLSFEYDKGTISFDLKNFEAADYFATVYLKSYYDQTRLWYGLPGNDFKFNFSGTRKQEKQKSRGIKIREISFNTYESFANWCTKYISHDEFGRIFYQSLMKCDSEIQQKIFAYYSHALKSFSKRNNSRATNVLKAFRILGISNVMMIAPEGPLAKAGGLSQVIVGLTSALIEENCSLTLVSPLYHRKNGNHHESAYTLINNQVKMFGENSHISLIDSFYLSDIDKSNDGVVRRLVDVYETKIGKCRLLFVYNKELADCLYGGISGSDYLRRCVFLAKASLELIAKDEYNCCPDIIITHDWTAALTKNIQQNYNSKVNEIPLLHVLHNAGEAYQGRFNLVENDQRVLESLGISKVCFNKSIEKSGTSINLTLGACRENDHAIITVSKPYAKQLINNDPESEFSVILREKRDHLYGISNGIPTNAVREAAFGISEDFEDLNLSSIIELKTKLKQEVQTQYGLRENSQNILAVLVGRLTDQKGLSILTDNYFQDLSVLEYMLEKYPYLEIIIAGPPAIGDNSFHTLESLVKKIPNSIQNRFRHRFEFIPHSEAIKLTAAADLFLMPSRYEPGGIAQLEALAVGTSVVAHRVGGLSATLTQFCKSGNKYTGNSFLFDSFDVDKFVSSFSEGCEVMKNFENKLNVIKSASSAKNDWRDRAPYYLSLFQKVVGVFDHNFAGQNRFVETRKELLSKVSAKSQ